MLFLDESGAHGGAPVFVLAGLAVHEHDAPHLSKRIEGALTYRLAALGLDAREYELHATKVKAGADEWAPVPTAVRLAVLGSAYRSLSTYECLSTKYPCALFGAVVDARYSNREERAYDLVLNKFDEMLGRLRHTRGERQMGMVIHDRRVVDTPLKRGKTKPTGRPKSVNIERRIQEWTADWQEVANRVGVLQNFSHVPLFADSRATRLVQLADFVCWALWRYYSATPPDERWIKTILDMFDSADGNMHGLIHVRPGFWTTPCSCPPCLNRAVS